MIVDAACYQFGQRIPGEFDYEEAGRLITDPDTFAWVGLHQPSPEEFEQAVKTFNLHELAVDDALRAHQRPSWRPSSDALRGHQADPYVDPVEIVDFGEILILVDADFAVAVRTVRPADSSRLGTSSKPIPEVRLRVGSGPPRHPPSGGEDYAVVFDELGAHSGHRGRRLFLGG